MKKQVFALLCIITINGIAIADDTQTRLKAMATEKDDVFKRKGSSETYFSKICPKQLVFLQQAAKQGQAIAQLLLAGCYNSGKGITKDEAQAVAWLRKAAEQGDAKAQFSLGGMYYQGRGIAKDEAQAVAWYRKAAEQGDANAQYNLGGMYYQGTGIAKDEAQAVVWLRKAAEQGDAKAQKVLKLLHAGRGL